MTDHLSFSVASSERENRQLTDIFEDALPEISKGRKGTTTGDLSDFLFDITPETRLAIQMRLDVEDLKEALDAMSKQKDFLQSFLKALTAYGVDSRPFKSRIRVLGDQIQRLQDRQVTAKETNDSLLVLMDLKQRQASAIEARSAREQSTLARHQNQTLMVFTVVTVVFLPLSFIAAFLAIKITELPHNSSGDQQLSLAFILQNVLGPGLGCAALCVLIAFSGTIKRCISRIINWLSDTVCWRKRKIHDLETGSMNMSEKEKRS